MKKIMRQAMGWLAVTATSLVPMALHAQTDSTVTGNLYVEEAISGGTSSSTNLFQYRLDGIISATGPFTGTNSLLSSDIGQNESMFLWYPEKAALLAGYFPSTPTEANIGYISVNLGVANVASGSQSMAIGTGNLASNACSMALGTSNAATGPESFVAGTASTATGNFSVGLGFGAVSAGGNSAALNESVSSGFGSLSANDGTALGNYSTALGQATASSQLSVAIGQYNTNLSSTGATPTLTSWVNTDPLFEVGNGTGSSAKADAFVVYKNGTVAVHTELRCAQSGDLSMGSFTAGTAP